MRTIINSSTNNILFLVWEDVNTITNFTEVKRSNQEALIVAKRKKKLIPLYSFN